MRRIVAVIVALALVGSVAYFAFGRESSTADALEGERVLVERGTITAVVNATGNVEANEQVTLSFRSPGRVSEILVEEGDVVVEGEILARLDTTDLEFAVAQAESNVAVQEARLRQLEKPASGRDIQAAEAQLASAEEALARLQAGADLEEVRAAEAQLTSAREKLAQLQQGADPEDVAAARANLNAAQAALAELEAGANENELVAAQAEVDRAEAALKQAQAAYDRVAYRADISALPQSAELEQATISYEQARANFDSVVAGASADQLEQARANVAQAEAQLDNLLQGADSASVSAARAQLVQAESNLAQLQAGPDSADIRAAEAQVAQARASLEQLQEGADTEEVNVARANLEQAQLQVEQARADLEAATLTAPFGGTVATVGANEGELVTSAQPMITLADLSSFVIKVEVDEVDIAQVESGDPVAVFVDSMPDEEIKGAIEYISPVPNTSQAVVAYPVRIRLDDESEQKLRVGMSANVDIVTETLDNVLLVPNRAIEIKRETGELFVEKIEDGEVVRTAVRVGLRNEDVSQVTDGELEAEDVLLIRSVESRERLRQQLGG